jgi:DNA-binding NarL/FixJ family response regulator
LQACECACAVDQRRIDWDEALEPVLTALEREVLVLNAAAYSDQAIAARLYISPHTVTTHVGNILLKLDVTTPPRPPLAQPKLVSSTSLQKTPPGNSKV